MFHVEHTCAKAPDIMHQFDIIVAAKLRAGQVVSLAGTRIRLMPPGSGAAADDADTATVPTVPTE